MPFYAVARGASVGIFTNWNDCKNSVTGYSNAVFKKFNTQQEAEDFICLHNNESNNDTHTQDDEKGLQEKQQQIIKPDYYVYTDGACSNNGKENARAGFGIFFGIDDVRNVSKPIVGDKQTNNIAELTAIVETFPLIEEDIKNGKKVTIVSDSEYAIKCVSYYGEKCNQKEWKNVTNKELVQKAYNIFKDQPNIQFLYVKAHTGNNDSHSFGNSYADKLANESIGFEKCPATKIYLSVPFSKKDEIKKLGGLWDSIQKKWFVFEENPKLSTILAEFSRSNN